MDPFVVSLVRQPRTLLLSIGTCSTDICPCKPQKLDRCIVIWCVSGTKYYGRSAHCVCFSFYEAELGIAARPGSSEARHRTQPATI